MNRPDSDFDTARRGQELINYAKRYREAKPKAPMSEVADSFNSMEKHEQNGSRPMGSIPNISR